MAGIGEVSAIIGVAQAGISLSQVIIAFVGDVRDAPSTIVRIGNEIQTTSGRLKEIGALIEDNRTTQLFSDEGITDAARCSYECDLILAQVGNLLIKGGWKKDTQALDKNDIDLSLLSVLKWPFLKTRLETPRAELQIIKADLNLLFTSAMARRSSNPLTSEFAQDIPRLTKMKEWAARKAEKARQASRNSREEDSEGENGYYNWNHPRDSVVNERDRHQLENEDPEIYERFILFEQQKIREREDRKARERANLLRADDERKKEEEMARRRAIEVQAVEEYKKQQLDHQQQILAREQDLRGQLSGLGFESEQIESVLAIPTLQLGQPQNNSPATLNTNMTGPVVKKPDHLTSTTAPNLSSKRSSVRGLLGISHPRPSELDRFETNPTAGPLTEGPQTKVFNEQSDSIDLELWLVDPVAKQHTELALPRQWVGKEFQQIRKRGDVWQRLAQLQPMWRAAVQEFLKFRNGRESMESLWKPIDVALPRRIGKLAIFGHHHGNNLVKLTLSRPTRRQLENKMLPTGRRNTLAASSQPTLQSTESSGITLSQDDQAPLKVAEVEHDSDTKTSKNRNRVSFANEHADANEDDPLIPRTDAQGGEQKDESHRGAALDPGVFVHHERGPDGPEQDIWSTYIPKDLKPEQALEDLRISYQKSFAGRSLGEVRVDPSVFLKILAGLSKQQCSEILYRNQDFPETRRFRYTTYHEIAGGKKLILETEIAGPPIDSRIASDTVSTELERGLTFIELSVDSLSERIRDNRFGSKRLTQGELRELQEIQMRMEQISEGLQEEFGDPFDQPVGDLRIYGNNRRPNSRSNFPSSRPETLYARRDSPRSRIPSKYDNVSGYGPGRADGYSSRYQWPNMENEFGAYSRPYDGYYSQSGYYYPGSYTAQQFQRTSPVAPLIMPATSEYYPPPMPEPSNRPSKPSSHYHHDYNASDSAYRPDQKKESEQTLRDKKVKYDSRYQLPSDREREKSTIRQSRLSGPSGIGDPPNDSKKQREASMSRPRITKQPSFERERPPPGSKIETRHLHDRRAHDDDNISFGSSYESYSDSDAYDGSIRTRASFRPLRDRREDKKQDEKHHSFLHDYGRPRSTVDVSRRSARGRGNKSTPIVVFDNDTERRTLREPSSRSMESKISPIHPRNTYSDFIRSRSSIPGRVASPSPSVSSYEEEIDPKDLIAQTLERLTTFKNPDGKEGKKRDHDQNSPAAGEGLQFAKVPPPPSSGKNTKDVDNSMKKHATAGDPESHSSLKSKPAKKGERDELVVTVIPNDTKYGQRTSESLVRPPPPPEPPLSAITATHMTAPTAGYGIPERSDDQVVDLDEEEADGMILQPVSALQKKSLDRDENDKPKKKEKEKKKKKEEERSQRDEIENATDVIDKDRDKEKKKRRKPRKEGEQDEEEQEKLAHAEKKEMEKLKKKEEKVRKKKEKEEEERLRKGKEQEEDDRELLRIQEADSEDGGEYERGNEDVNGSASK